MSNPVKECRLAGKSEAARYFGVSPALITRKFKQGKLVIVDGKIDLDASAHVFTPQKPSPDKPRTPDAGGQDAEEPQAGVETFATAQRRKETALANLRELEHRQKSGTLVELAEEERLFATIAQTLREGLLSLPELIAPELAALTDPRLVRDRLDKDFHTLLNNLPAQLRAATQEAT